MSTQPDDTPAFGDLPDSEQAVLEALTASAPLARTAIGAAVAENTPLSAATTEAAVKRLRDRGLIHVARMSLRNPNEYAYALTDRGQAWVREGGDAA
jgi:DNA-binding PadR family transcriptional regulator